MSMFFVVLLLVGQVRLFSESSYDSTKTLPLPADFYADDYRQAHDGALAKGEGLVVVVGQMDADEAVARYRRLGSWFYFQPEPDQTFDEGVYQFVYADGKLLADKPKEYTESDAIHGRIPAPTPFDDTTPTVVKQKTKTVTRTTDAGVPFSPAPAVASAPASASDCASGSCGVSSTAVSNGRYSTSRRNSAPRERRGFFRGLFKRGGKCGKGCG